MDRVNSCSSIESNGKKPTIYSVYNFLHKLLFFKAHRNMLNIETFIEPFEYYMNKIKECYTGN